MRAELWLQIAAYLTWIVCGVPAAAAMIEGRLSSGRAWLVTAAFLAFGAAFTSCSGGWAAEVPRRVKIALLALQVAAAALLVAFSASFQPAALFVIIAAELPFVFEARATFGWMVAQSALVAALFWSMDGPMAALVGGGAFAGFQMFAVSTAWLTRSESVARQALARTNAELTATRELLAENSRAAERLRIARDLHDTLGHHLTALSLQLEVASRLTDGTAAAHIREAQAVAKLLLGDVRAVVSRLRESRHVDLSNALRALTRAPGALNIHLDMPERLELEDANQAHALLRCVQEFLTNTTRHAAAKNVWITIAQRPEGIELRARDDGRGADALEWGNGLRGMRERFEEYAGRVDVQSSAGRGFEVRAFMPASLDATEERPAGSAREAPAHDASLHSSPGAA
jgi:signal transduction histidine kinase